MGWARRDQVANPGTRRRSGFGEESAAPRLDFLGETSIVEGVRSLDQGRATAKCRVGGATKDGFGRVREWAPSVWGWVGSRPGRWACRGGGATFGPKLAGVLACDKVQRLGEASDPRWRISAPRSIFAVGFGGGGMPCRKSWKSVP